MKRILILFLISLPQIMFGQYQTKAFILEDDNREITSAYIGCKASSDTIIILSVNQPITGMSLSGSSLLGDKKDSYIRVTMKDDYNYEYLLYETYPSLAGNNRKSSFSNIGLETLVLEKVIPASIKIEVKDATIEIESLQYTTSIARLSSLNSESIHKEQCQYIVERLNENLESGKSTWRAGVTSMSEKSYEDKKAMFGGTVPQLYGFEHYIGGIFVMPDVENQTSSRSVSSSQYVTEWDWRNRHGKNWMTPVKDQGGCGSCWAFSAVGTLEAYINLYYNQQLECDLSEQEIVSCSNEGDCSSGSLSGALNYIKNNGIVPDNCFTYTATNNSCGNKCTNPSDIMSFYNYSNAYSTNEDNIKQLLFTSPICFGIDPWFHFVTLAGYKQIQSGEYYFTHNSYLYKVLIDDNNPLIGHPAWLIKNSWNTTWGDGGYGYVAMSLEDAYGIFKITGPVYSQVYSSTDIVCEDNDGDGFYFWGIGPKPSSCPSWVPDTPDGDDSDYLSGPLNQYGYLQDLTTSSSQNEYITTSQTYFSRFYKHCNVVINCGVTLTLKNILTVYPLCKVLVKSGGKLVVDGGTLNSSNIEMESGSELIMRNNGIIHMTNGSSFLAPLGAVINIESGSIY